MVLVQILLSVCICLARRLSQTCKYSIFDCLEIAWPWEEVWREVGNIHQLSHRLLRFAFVRIIVRADGGFVSPIPDEQAGRDSERNITDEVIQLTGVEWS